MPVEMKRRIASAIAEKKFRLTDPLKKYNPLPGSRSLGDFHRTLKRYAIIFGGNRSGKTEANMAQVAMIARDMHPYFTPNRIGREIKTIWVAGVTFHMAGTVLWQEKLQKYIPKKLIDWSGVVWISKRANIPHIVPLKNGKTLYFKSYDQGRDTFQSASVDFIALDEQPPWDIWQECQMRVADNDGFIRLSCTPLKHQPELERISNTPPPSYWVGFASLNDNRRSRGGFVPDAVIDELIAEWPEATRITRIEGRFAAFLGAVFQEWNAEEHIVNPRDLPREWEHFIGIDFGYTNPFCALLMARDPDGGFWMIAEHYEPQMLLRDHAKVIRKWQHQFKVKQIIGDHAAQDRAELEALGVHVTPQKKKVLRSIEAMASMMRIENGRTRIHVFRKTDSSEWRGCPRLIEEIPSYRWAEPTSDRNAKEEPLKFFDHAIDAAKGVIFTINEHGRGRMKTGSLA